MKEAKEFYDVKTKTKFTSSNWRVDKKVSEKDGRTRYFAVARSPQGTHDCYLTISKDLGEANL